MVGYRVSCASLSGEIVPIKSPLTRIYLVGDPRMLKFFGVQEIVEP